MPINSRLLKNVPKIIIALFAGLVLFTSSVLMTYVFLSEIYPKIFLTGMNPVSVTSNFLINIPKAYVIQSGSMEPSIKTGSVVITLPSASYAQGDVITFAQNGNSKRLITHRIITRMFPQGLSGSAKYITGGDANEEFDNWEVKNEDIVGKAVLTIPYLGYVSDFAKKPQGFILLVIVPATIVIYEELKSLYWEVLKKLRKVMIYFRGRSFKDRRTMQANFHTGSGNAYFPKKYALVPIISVLVFMLTFSLGYFTDLDKSIGNILGAASSYGEKQANIYDGNDFTCPAGASNTTTDLGNVFMKISGSTLKVDVVLDGATASSAYDIWVNQDPNGCPLASATAPGALTTDVNGNGNAHVETPLVVGTTNFWITAVGGGQVLRSTAVTLP